MTEDDDPRVLTLAREYLAELEAGRTPARAGYEGRFPELRDAVAECLDGVELAHAAGVALRPPAPPPPPETSPEPLGDFRIVREIGRGGMGVVYEAVQLSLGRRVALKVLPFAAGLDAKHLQRFKTEAHAAAQLHHTNIVPVYAVGSDRGTHYYAMQLIDGRPLDAVIRELRNDDQPRVGDSTVDVVMSRSTASVKPPVSATVGTTSRRDRTAYATAARFAAQVADALEYAHDAGVIHRDIKPANLLLDARGTVWVTDFGLAQVQAEANVTRTGDVFGTLRYSSPEQATGRRTEVDARTDVYSLGATLYELLTLQPIFPDLDRQSLLFRIINEEPVPPRQHDKAIPEELETIVLKAVSKTPADRYATAGEFAADLRRFLDDRPILARRPTLLDLGRKWLRRHPAYTYAGLVVLLLAAVGFGISTAVVAGAKHQTDDALQQAEHALDREKQRAKEAEDRFRIARQLADEHIRVANEDLAYDPVQVGLRQRMLQTALAYYQGFIDLRKDDPKAVEELALVRGQVSQILSDLAVLAGANRLDLLRHEVVWEELQLSKVDGERLAARVIADRLDAGKPGELSPEQVNARMVERARRLDKAIRPELTADQWARLNQIFIQHRGPRAFDLPEVIDALKLTIEDRTKLRQAERSVIVKRLEFGGAGPGGPGGFGGPGGPGGGGRGGGKPPDRGSFGGGPGGEGGRRGPGGDGPFERGQGDRGQGDGRRPDGQGNRVLYQQFILLTVTDMLDVLKPEQKEEWKRLTGEPFAKLDQLYQQHHMNGPLEGGGPGGGGPGGPGGPGGGRLGGGR